MKFDFGAIPKKFGKSMQKVFGSANQRSLKAIQAIVDEINGLSAWAEGLSDDQIRAKIEEMKGQIQSGSLGLDDALPEVFAMTREAAVRTIGLRHFDVQLIGGITLHQGNIAEMVTGEGKTLVATLAAALNAMTGKGVFVITVNDYLALRDRNWMAPVLEFLGLTVGAIQSSMSPSMRHAEYACDVIYGTNNEFGFDYLRDNMKWDPEEQVQKRLYHAIIDEVDSILVDEARTPLIISGPPEGKGPKYLIADRIARQLNEGEHFEVKLKEQQCLLSEAGTERAEQLAGVDSFYSNPEHMEWPHHIEQSLRAHNIYRRDKDYIIGQNKQGQVEVVIVDEFTGRLMAGRRWSDGLHQAIEAKEGMTPQEESQTLATITLQNYFRMFEKLSGMTGTAMTEASEFGKIYDLAVVAIPTNREMKRDDLNDLIYLDEKDKLAAIVEEVREENGRGRPILVGTTSIEKSERISDVLKEAGISHEVLNAKQHEREADIIVQAGKLGAVTVATNMAGRGTDIVLGGNPERLAQSEAEQKGWDLEGSDYSGRLKELEAQCLADREEILSLGGLLVIGTERHEARRIDNQLRGRCGRQGDPGKTKFFLSFDDDLMRIFARDWVKTMMGKLGLKEGEVIESGMVTRGIERAQRKVEARNFDIRKNLLEYDEVMDKQRKFVYTQRQDILELNDLDDKVRGMFEEVLDPVIEAHGGDKDHPVDYAELTTWLTHKAGAELDLSGFEQVGREDLFDWIMKRVESLLDARRQDYGEEKWAKLLQFLLLDTIDTKWKDHLHAMEVLKAGVGLRGYAQVDPKDEYKKEGFEKFKLLKEAIADQVSNLVFRAEIQQEEMHQQMSAPAAPPQLPPDPVTAQAMVQAMIAAGQAPQEIIDAVAQGATVQVKDQAQAQQEQQMAAAQQKAEEDARNNAIKQELAGKRVGRNDSCPCGSGIKYKKCCHPAFG